MDRARINVIIRRPSDDDMAIAAVILSDVLGISEYEAMKMIREHDLRRRMAKVACLADLAAALAG